MDLDSRLASLSLGEIASLLSPKQQEVLLASISVAASFIQQIQQEEQLQAEERLRQEDILQVEGRIQQHLQQQQQQQQHHHQQQHLQQHQTVTSNDNKFNNRYPSDQRLSSAQSFNDDDDDRLDTDEEELDDEEDDDTFQTSTTSSTAPRQHRLSNHHNTTTSPTNETDEKDLLTIRQFAEELKHRRKAIRLSQKGAAQSLRAFTGGVQPCTDAIIYHFENLQLEPDRAMQLIPLLRDWLEWAEKHRYNGKTLPMMSAVTKVPRERKRKVVLFNDKAKQYLEDAFAKNNHPDRYQLDVISQELNIPTRSIRKWFTNRRQRKRFAEKFSPIS